MSVFIFQQCPGVIKTANCVAFRRELFDKNSLPQNIFSNTQEAVKVNFMIIIEINSTHLPNDRRQGRRSFLILDFIGLLTFSVMNLLLRKGRNILVMVRSVCQMRLSMVSMLRGPTRISLWKASSPRLFLVEALMK